MSYEGERPHAGAWAEKKLRVGGEAAIDDYMAKKNAESIDGLPAFEGTGGAVGDRHACLFTQRYTSMARRPPRSSRRRDADESPKRASCFFALRGAHRDGAGHGPRGSDSPWALVATMVRVAFSG